MLDALPVEYDSRVKAVEVNEELDTGGTKRFDSEKSGNREVQQTVLVSSTRRPYQGAWPILLSIYQPSTMPLSCRTLPPITTSISLILHFSISPFRTPEPQDRAPFSNDPSRAHILEIQSCMVTLGGERCLQEGLYHPPAPSRRLHPPYFMGNPWVNPYPWETLPAPMGKISHGSSVGAG